MDNAYFLFTSKDNEICIARFHICTWEFQDNSALAEFGFEIESKSLAGKSAVEINLFVPWLNKESSPKDFYLRLKDTSNSRFIFNDAIVKTENIDRDSGRMGVVHHFGSRGQLCILPIKMVMNNAETLTITIDLTSYNSFYAEQPIEDRPNAYARFAVTPNLSEISTRRHGIAKSTILYDIKLNERRNLPDSLLTELNRISLCKVKVCFCLNILPNSYDLVFFDSKVLQNVRTLEYSAFKQYLKDDRIKDSELLVIFNKKRDDQPLSFFSIYSKERIGIGQFALAVSINFLCGILLFIANYRRPSTSKIPFQRFLKELPVEIWLALGITILISLFFLAPILRNAWRRCRETFKNVSR